MTWLFIFLTSALSVIAGIAILNTLTLPRLKRRAPRHPPTVSVLIPARNESAVIAHTVRALLAQPEAIEVLLLDDHSSDGTAALAHSAAAGDHRLRVLNGEPLPAGWLGKNWACHQLAQAATGEVLVFTDADVLWQPGALAAVLIELENTRADVLTVWPTQITQHWGERLVVPLMALALIGYLPVLAVHHLPGRVFAAAVGQCLVFRRAAYARLGGHAAVRASIVEDVALAAQAKGLRLRLRMAESAGLLHCRMYAGWAEVRAGFAKNILAGHGSISGLGLSTLFHWLVFVGPWLLAATAPAWRSWALLLIGLGVGVRALSAAVTGQRIRDAVLLPLSVMLMTVIAAQALVWHYRGGPRWKGRVAARPPLPKN